MPKIGIHSYLCMKHMKLPINQCNLLLHRSLGLVSILLLLLTSSCVSRKDIAYFNDLNSSTQIGKITPPEIRLKPGDLLSIQIFSSDVESAVPFNLHQLSTGGQLPSYTNGVGSQQGYLIDKDGHIELPIIGQLDVGNKTRSEALNIIKLSLKPYLNNPVVHFRILNFKVTVLGDVRAPGTFNIPNEQISLPEALGIAGDLNLTAQRKNILVIREIDGVKNSYRVDLTSSEMFKSPVFYLIQNDIVYVEPNRAQRNSASINSRAGIIISAASLILSIAILLK